MLRSPVAKRLLPILEFCCSDEFVFASAFSLSLAVRACLCKFSSSREQNDSSEGQTESTKMILGQEVFETQEVERDGQPLEIRIRGFPQ